MNINDSAPLTDMSETTQANNKYKKALKQINRLISINNSVKKELMAVQEEYDSLRNKHSLLQEKYNALQDEYQNQVSNRGLQNMAKVAFSGQEPYNTSSQFNQDTKFGLGFSQKKQKDSSPLSTRAKQLENTGTLSEYMDTKRKLEKLQQKLQERDKQIQAITLELQSKSKENTQLLEKYAQASSSLSKIRNEFELKNTGALQKSIQALKNEISKYKQANSKILKENESLKNNNKNQNIERTASNPKGLQAFSVTESKNPIFASIKGRPPAVPYHQSFYSAAQQSLQNSGEKLENDPFPEYYFKKVRDLENEIIRLKKQHSEKRSSYKNQISNLKQHIQAKDEHIKQISNFVVKQQAFIQSLYERNELGLKNTRQAPKMVSSLTDYTKSCQNSNIDRVGMKNTLSKKALLTSSQQQAVQRQGDYNYYKN